MANSDTAIDLVQLALQMDATYVARSFSGDKEQLIPLIKGAFKHGSSAFLDVISPCVTFNNHAVNRLDFLLPREKITAGYPPVSLKEVTQHDGSVLCLRKLTDDYNPRDRIAAVHHLQEHQSRGELVTDLLYVDPDAGDLHHHLRTVATPLNRLSEIDLCPGADALGAIHKKLR